MCPLVRFSYISNKCIALHVCTCTCALYLTSIINNCVFFDNKLHVHDINVAFILVFILLTCIDR